MTLLIRALQHPFVVWFVGLAFRVLCSTCCLKCLNDACIGRLHAFVGAEVINVAGLAFEEADTLRVSYQECFEYFL